MASSKEEFDAFSREFGGFPRELAEDTVEYAIYIIDSKLSEPAVRLRLNEVLRESKEVSKKYLKDYIWQKESFSLELKRQDGLSYLAGSTNFGDSVADEWLIVWLLVELSKKFADAWIRIYDNDGEFLLIEAADKLPPWLTPEVSDNRVWMNTGKLNLILVDTSKQNADAKGGLGRSDAIKLISSSPNSLVHDESIQSDAFRRIQNYPSAISSSLHTSLITVPRKLAFILHRLPTSISPAIECFYLRDPVALKPLQSPTTAKLRFRPEDFVTISVRFSKVGFAQIKSQQFAVPPSWRAAMAQLMTEKELSAKEIARLETGMKVTCGFEMLLREPARKNDRAVREIQILLDDVEGGEEELSTDEEINGWSQQDEDEGWLDIDFTDFDRELSGSAAGEGSSNAKAWTDKSAQENLRKVVEKFEKFMNDEDAGLDGADFGDEDEDESEEDEEVEFDEKRYANLMREMVGLPPEEALNAALSQRPALLGNERVEQLSDEGDEGADVDLQELERVMEGELKGSSSLSLQPFKKWKGKQKAVDHEPGETEEPIEDEDVDIDYNLAQNLLESLKGQAGVSGPAGNLMCLMGVSMPRDELEEK